MLGRICKDLIAISEILLTILKMVVIVNERKGSQGKDKNK